MQKKMLKIGVILAVMAVAACETVQGAGRDLQTGGQIIQQESAQTQAEL